MRNFILLTIGHGAAWHGAAGSITSASAYAHAQHLGARAHPAADSSCDFVNQLARETR